MKQIYRLNVIIPLYSNENMCDNKILPYAAGLSFAIPHFWGIPGGWIGSIMAFYLGFVNGNAMIDTKGICASWFMHFIQDFVLFSVKYALIQTNTNDITKTK